jgi:hypothetical protein
MEVLLVLFGIVAITLVLLCYNAFSWGYVSYVLYGWFILPTFPEAPQLSILQFVGIALFLSALKPHLGPVIKSEYEDDGAKWSKIILAPWLLLLFAWFIHLFY